MAQPLKKHTDSDLDEDGEQPDDLSDMDPQERAALTRCIDEALADVDRGDYSQFLPLEDLLAELRRRR